MLLLDLEVKRVASSLGICYTLEFTEIFVNSCLQSTHNFTCNMKLTLYIVIIYMLTV